MVQTSMATIPWLDHVKAFAKKTGFNPLEIGMSKLKDTALCDINAASKEDTLLYFWFHHLLMEHSSNVPCVPDALNAYAHLMQGKNESITQYLTRAKVPLGNITIILKCAIFQELAMTNSTLFEDCAHHMSKEGLCPNRTLGIQWKMSSKQLNMSSDLKRGTGHSSTLIWKHCS